MAPFSLHKQKTMLHETPERPQNVILHIADRIQKNVEIQIAYHGSSWAEVDGKNRGMLSFNIELIQPRASILKDTQITLSFDCHPTNKECHTPQAGNNDCQIPDKRHRGVVEGSLPGSMYGRIVDRYITHHGKWQLAPSIAFASFGPVSLGSYERGNEWAQNRQRSWIFNSRVLPPTGYNDFPVHTNARFEWRYNKYDPTDFPKSIRVGVIVDCLTNHRNPLPMALSIDGSLGGALTYFSKRENHEVFIPIGKELKDRDALLQQIESIHYQSDSLEVVTFRVECPDTSQGDVSVRLVGEGDILGRWDTRRAYALTKVADDGHTAAWKIDKLVNRWQDFQYKFIKESNGGRSVEWEVGENRKYSVTDGTQPELSPPSWPEPEHVHVM